MQEREDRNDSHMQSILDKTHNMQLNKIEASKYSEDWESLDKRFIDMENYNKENHIHYIQIENFVEKYLPIK